MKHRQLYLAALAHSFGSASERPMHAAIMRLLGLAGAAGVISLLVSRGLQNLPLGPVPHPELLAFAAALAVQLSVGLSLLITQGLMRAGQADTLVKLLITWPLTHHTRWAVYMLPSLVLGGLAVVLVGWPLAVVLTKLGVPLVLLAVAFAVGYITAFGLVQSLPPALRLLLPVWVCAVVWTEYTLVQHIHNVLLPLDTRWLYAVGCSTVFLLLGGLFTVNSRHLLPLLTAPDRSAQARFTLRPGLWFAAKFLRRPSIRLSFTVTFAISLLAAMTATRQHVNEPGTLVIFGAILAASLATDIRALARRYNPAEITVLKGASRFVSSYVAYTWAAAVLAITPIIAVLVLLPYHWTAGQAIQAGLQLCAGTLAGAFAGSVIVPAGRDISGQFMATILVLGILFVWPQLGPVQHLGPAWRNALDALMCAALLAGIYLVEYKRNPYRWRKPIHARQT